MSPMKPVTPVLSAFCMINGLIWKDISNDDTSRCNIVEACNSIIATTSLSLSNLARKPRIARREIHTHGFYTDDECLSAQIAHRVDATESRVAHHQRFELVELARVCVPKPDVSRFYSIPILWGQKSKTYRRREARKCQLQRYVVTFTIIATICEQWSSTANRTMYADRVRERENESFKDKLFKY